MTVIISFLAKCHIVTQPLMGNGLKNTVVNFIIKLLLLVITFHIINENMSCS